MLKAVLEFSLQVLVNDKSSNVCPASPDTTHSMRLVDLDGLPILKLKALKPSG